MVKLSGGDKLESALNKIAAKLKKSASIDVGFKAGATEEDGTSVPMIAAIQEFGAPSRGIPPRPFFRTMIEKNIPQWPGQVAGLLQATDYDAAKTLAILGEDIKGELQQSIIDVVAPPLSPITLMLRKMKAEGVEITGKSVGEAAARVAAGESSDGVSDKPLVDTGTMLGSITSTVNT